MVASLLQDDLIEELAKVLDGMLFLAPSGKRVPIGIYKQWLPIPGTKDLPEGATDEMIEEGGYPTESTIDPYPYIIVRLLTGKIDEPNGEQLVNLALIIGIYNPDFDNQGFTDLCNIIQRIYARFGRCAILGHEYECVSPIEWVLQDENSYPFYIGCMFMNFKTVPIRREGMYT